MLIRDSSAGRAPCGLNASPEWCPQRASHASTSFPMSIINQFYRYHVSIGRHIVSAEGQCADHGDGPRRPPGGPVIVTAVTVGAGHSGGSTAVLGDLVGVGAGDSPDEAFEPKTATVVP